jgi:hypothetical protein
MRSIEPGIPSCSGRHLHDRPARQPNHPKLAAHLYPSKASPRPCQPDPERVAKALFRALRPRAGTRRGLQPQMPSEKRARSSAG